MITAELKITKRANTVPFSQIAEGNAFTIQGQVFIKTGNTTAWPLSKGLCDCYQTIYSSMEVVPVNVTKIEVEEI